jgi:hypothetical protein
VADLTVEEIELFLETWKHGGGIAAKVKDALHDLVRVKRAQEKAP